MKQGKQAEVNKSLYLFINFLSEIYYPYPKFRMKDAKKVLICGAKGVGKTSILENLINGSINKVSFLGRFTVNFLFILLIYIN
jgi:hypothetical protein